MSEHNELRIRTPDDFHVHLRQGKAMAAYAARSAASFGRLLVMPNTLPPIADSASIVAYRASIEAALAQAKTPNCQLLMTFKLLPGMSAETVIDCAKAGAVAGKYYPAGATTNAHDGVSHPDQIREALAAMQSAGLVLSIHGEDPTAPAMDREQAFLPVVDQLVQDYPKLRIVLEHLSSQAAVDAVLNWPERVAATLTAHHLAYTTENLLGDKLNSAYFCRPLLKSGTDRQALIRAACSGSPKFFFGSDSAPHPATAKLGTLASPGCYTSPLALSLLAGLFEAVDALDRLEYFTSTAGADFYGLAYNPGKLLLQKKAWTVPEETDEAVTPEAGRLLDWTAVRL